MKFIDKLLIFILVSSLIGIGSIGIMMKIQNAKLQANIKSISKENMNVSPMSADVTPSADDLIVDDTVSSDQKVKKVSKYKNVLSIPQYKILVNIYPNTSRESLTYGVGHYEQTKEVGELGNCSLAGHSSTIYNCILNPVKDMNIGDTFICYDKVGVKHTYYVTNMVVVEPTETYVLNTTDTDVSYVKLITCTNGGKQRLCITGAELSKKDALDLINSINKKKIDNMIKINDNINTHLLGGER